MTASDRMAGDVDLEPELAPEPELELEVVEADPGGGERLSVVWLHGMGQDTGDAVAIAARLRLAGQGVRAVFPRAPAQAASPLTGALSRAWVDQSVLNLAKTDETTLWATERRVRAVVAAEARRLGPERVVLAGFSQGAAMALLVALSHPDRLGGVALYAPYLFGDVPLFETRNAANAGLPVWIGHGRRDWVIPYYVGIGVKDLLTENGHPVEWHRYRGAHEAFGGVGPELGEFLDRVAGRRG